LFSANIIFGANSNNLSITTTVIALTDPWDKIALSPGRSNCLTRVKSLACLNWVASIIVIPAKLPPEKLFSPDLHAPQN